jgi:anaerobic magnesium-protoporphyrin IX monomethyl ester cyclase
VKVVFINPWSQDEEGVKWSPNYQTHYWRNAYFGLVQIATFVRSLGHDVTIIDAERDLLMEARGKTKLLLKQIRQKVANLHPDVVGVSGMSWRYPVTSKIFDVLAPLSTKMGFRLIQGGHHAIAYPEGCLSDHPELDAVFNGFAEVGLKRYLEGVPRNNVPGIVYKDGANLSRTPSERVGELDSLPMPDWSLLDAKFYTYPCVWVHRSLTTPVRNLDTIASRGCTFRCKFCTWSTGNPIWHSVDYVIDYIKYIRREYGVNSTMFQDSSLGNNRPFLIELCEKLISTDIKKGLIWTANMRVNQVDAEIARLMYQAGCRMVFIGFESASDRILQAINKGVTSEDNVKCARALEMAGMPYWASFIVGYPGETEEDLKMTMEFARSIHPLAGWANEFFPSPGSRIFHELVKGGRLSIPADPEGWASISRIGQKGGVLEGGWSEMSPNKFRKLTQQFQVFMQDVTDQGVQRRLEFPT